jgi:transcriptional regulator with XRE-family HTH domain
MMSDIQHKPYRTDLIKAKMAVSEPRITQESLAESAGVSRTTVIALINGSPGVSYRSIKAVADALDISMAELFTPKPEQVMETTNEHSIPERA